MRQEILQAIQVLVMNGYGVFRVPTEVLPRVQPVEDDEAEELALGKQNYTIKEFCMLYGIGRTFFYELIRQEKGPNTIKIGKKVLIPRAAAEHWQACMDGSYQGAEPINGYAHLRGRRDG